MHREYVRMCITLVSQYYVRRDFNIMDKTVLLAKQNGVKVGAHPSLPDRQGWGRREMAMEPVSTCSPTIRTHSLMVP